MTHKRQLIRERWVGLLQAATPTTKIEANRTHSVSKFPLINVMTGSDQADLEAHTLESKARILDLMLELNVASNNHDNEIDDFIEVLDEIIEDNLVTDIWSSCQFDAADEPESVAGKTDYTICKVHILIKYEV